MKNALKYFIIPAVVAFGLACSSTKPKDSVPPKYEPAVSVEKAEYKNLRDKVEKSSGFYNNVEPLRMPGEKDTEITKPLDIYSPKDSSLREIIGDFLVVNGYPTDSASMDINVRKALKRYMQVHRTEADTAVNIFNTAPAWKKTAILGFYLGSDNDIKNANGIIKDHLDSLRKAYSANHRNSLNEFTKNYYIYQAVLETYNEIDSLFTLYEDFVDKVRPGELAPDPPVSFREIAQTYLKAYRLDESLSKKKGVKE